MDLSSLFRSAVADAYDDNGADPESVPMSLCQACVQVLPIAGAGISLTDQLRVPLGASDAVAARAERLQTTLGEGPCLAAAAAARPLVADLESMAARWPVFHQELLRQTPFRSIASFPLLARNGATRLGALDLYLVIPEPVPEFFLSVVAHAIAAPIGTVLFDAEPGPAGRNVLPPWLNNVAVNRRMQVWVAVGILIEHAGSGNDDALAALRAYAFAHDETIEDTAVGLLSQELHPQAVIGERTPA